MKPKPYIAELVIELHPNAKPPTYKDLKAFLLWQLAYVVTPCTEDIELAWEAIAKVRVRSVNRE